ncbi:5-formyltetrahydrofolate cyclo-ligase [Aneurinibacillus aneurinilyticus]|jgi:5-formyltetrahydrofolate cyclo-ligase|uniref:5-formyltetrahydrofolate cyclo-ligase n=1 Tax=Aneurinibacillus aneurinilyticus TaxID=1391 RepID=UPI0023F10ACA|nr:5-formyltetrahydrofolate cyclo-ligase [Aneurinibacillus aneurinilyticus]MCI1694068.1 5-formyltetrahydrofolate cyclo-ligase [Aneurinibacillus aneurinilyticus]MED0671254.1 5-formyltetrahydrofolate cyclo-ligase [Aneurinibacillus aneurinilyticus]
MNVEERKESKRLLRRQIIKQRADIVSHERDIRSEEATRRLLAVPEVEAAQRLFVFLSFGEEVCLDRFIAECDRLGKSVYVPKTYVKDRQMIPYRFTGWNTFIEGAYGIREPDEAKSEPWHGEPFDVILVPGVAFTEQGERLGYGGGFYDRFFAGLPNVPPLVAVCYEMQVVPFLSVEEHDRKMDKIVTESRVITCS